MLMSFRQYTEIKAFEIKLLSPEVVSILCVGRRCTINCLMMIVTIIDAT